MIKYCFYIVLLFFFLEESQGKQGKDYVLKGLFSNIYLVPIKRKETRWGNPDELKRCKVGFVYSKETSFPLFYLGFLNILQSFIL